MWIPGAEGQIKSLKATIQEQKEKYTALRNKAEMAASEADATLVGGCLHWPSQVLNPVVLNRCFEPHSYGISPTLHSPGFSCW
jgi:hypothetical protein